ncbi:hypothetical protein HID58_095855 [Brassica napus]|uniref:Uncharacterized protein n=1 Tax=Brassica napus TaxID=3708 RepID=A0ABQ7X259_BRANA|nr:hypothetical protein HID58_095855 [Brassica napus]
MTSTLLTWASNLVTRSVLALSPNNNSLWLCTRALGVNAYKPEISVDLEDYGVHQESDIRVSGRRDGTVMYYRRKL